MFSFKITTVIGSAYQGIDILKFALVLALDSPWLYVIKCCNYNRIIIGLGLISMTLPPPQCR